MLAVRLESEIAEDPTRGRHGEEGERLGWERMGPAAEGTVNKLEQAVPFRDGESRRGIKKGLESTLAALDRLHEGITEVLRNKSPHRMGGSRRGPRKDSFCRPVAAKK